MTRFHIRLIGGRIGAEVTGVNPAGIDDDLFAYFEAALLEYKALVFRDTGLDDEGQIAFASRFGHLARISVREEGIGSGQWHADATFVRTPPKISTLRAVVVPPYGGDTLIANAAAAYRDLPAELREFADRLWAVHTDDDDPAQPRVRYRTGHPVVRVHPESGERGLFIGGFANTVVGLSGAESRDILRILQAYVTRPENVLRVRWKAGDLVVTDNRVTQHYAPGDHGDLPRRLHRVTVAGEVPAGVDGRESYVIEGGAARPDVFQRPFGRVPVSSSSIASIMPTAIDR